MFSTPRGLHVVGRESVPMLLGLHAVGPEDASAPWGLYCRGRDDARPSFTRSFFGPSDWEVVLWVGTLSAWGMLAGSEAGILSAVGCVFEAGLHFDGLKRQGEAEEV